MAYLNSIRIMQSVDHYLEVSHPDMKRAERSNTRFHLARAAAAFALSSSRPKVTVLPRIDPQTFDSERLEPVFEWVMNARDAARSSTGIIDDNVLAKGPEWSKGMDRRLSRYSDKNRWPKRITARWS